MEEQMKIFPIVIAILLAGCSSGLPISRYDAEAIVKAGGSVTVSAGEFSRYDIEAVAKAAQGTSARIVVVDSSNLSRYDMEAIGKAAPGVVLFED